MVLPYNKIAYNAPNAIQTALSQIGYSVTIDIKPFYFLDGQK
jgi:hypothetical protein